MYEWRGLPCWPLSVISKSKASSLGRCQSCNISLPVLQDMLNAKKRHSCCITTVPCASSLELQQC